MSEFKGRHFRGEIVLWAVRWYCRYAVSYRDLEAKVKYLNNVVEADHGKLKLLIRPVRGFKTMKTAYATIKGFEVMRALWLDDQIEPISVCVASGLPCLRNEHCRQGILGMRLGAQPY